jgi:hypothetical protein
MNILRLIIYFFLIFPPYLKGQDTPQEEAFSIDDLVSLYNAGEVDEFLAKAKEIKPSIRGPKWRAMVTQFTIQKIDALLQLPSNTMSFDEVLKVETYATYSHHLKDSQLQNKKLELGIKFLTSTLKEIDKWEATKVLEIKKWWYLHWQSSLKLPLYAYNYLKLFNDYSPLSKFESTNLISFFEGQEQQDNLMQQLLQIIYHSGLAGDLCKDPWVWNFLWPNIKQFVGNLKKSDQDQFDIKIVKEFSLSCWNSTKSRLLENFHRLSEEDIHFSIHLLSLDKTLSQKQKIYIHIYYLLFEPFPSDLYNQALNTLLSLSLNESTRLEILQQFLKLDPMEGKVFTLNTAQSLEVLLRLSRSFPEYLDGYAQTCLDFLTGDKKFPAGNPTPHCVDFCRKFKQQNTSFFTKPVYKLIENKFMGQCDKTAP